jgi:hypothetical protein
MCWGSILESERRVNAIKLRATIKNFSVSSLMGERFSSLRGRVDTGRTIALICGTTGEDLRGHGCPFCNTKPVLLHPDLWIPKNGFLH